jgi:hypothetical protein
MKDLSKAVILRIYIGEKDSAAGKPLYEQIVFKARELGLAGCTVLKGVMGFGAHSHMHSAKLLRLSEDLPVVIEIVDTQENVERLMPYLEENLEEAVVTKENVDIVKYSKNE